MTGILLIREATERQRRSHVKTEAETGVVPPPARNTGVPKAGRGQEGFSGSFRGNMAL